MGLRRALWILATLAGLLSATSAGWMATGNAGESGQAAFSPPPGDPVRKAVLDGLRADVHRLHQLDPVFVVDAIRVSDGWAWVEVSPRSKDGQALYEPLAALMARRGGAWVVVAYACEDSEEAECDWHQSVRRLMREHPKAPAAIFPPAQ